MKIAIDISPLQNKQQGRGIGFYTKNLITALKQVDTENEYILTSNPKGEGVDLIHYPYFDFFFATLPIRHSAKVVVTVHDTIPLVFPEHFPPGIRGRLKFYIQQQALNRVDAIITDSHHSKQDIHTYLHQSLDRISTIHLAADTFQLASQKNQASVRSKYQLPAKYLLYVGDINYTKNLPALLQAFSQITDDVNLVLVSRALKNQSIPEAKTIINSIGQHQLYKRVTILTDVPLKPSTDLNGIYSAATAYVQPSLYEGFGLPVLEAMASGTPVVAAKAASLPEVAGEAAIYFNPTSISSMRNAIQFCLHLSDEQRTKMITSGIKHAQQFTWEKTARKTYSLYMKLINS